MKYLLMLYAKESGWSELAPADRERLMGAYSAFTNALQQSGALLASNRLQPIATATTVRVADGKTTVLDGPYADTKEQFGGFYLIEAADLDAALKWAGRCPSAAHGVVEVRPVWE